LVDGEGSQRLHHGQATALPAAIDHESEQRMRTQRLQEVEASAASARGDEHRRRRFDGESTLKNRTLNERRALGPSKKAPRTKNDALEIFSACRLVQNRKSVGGEQSMKLVRRHHLEPRGRHFQRDGQAIELARDVDEDALIRSAQHAPRRPRSSAEERSGVTIAQRNDVHP
jgi:hypothetical protein